jgi:GAF domain-containing protein
MSRPPALPSIGLPKEVLSGWQSSVDILAKLLKVPVGVITRLRNLELEVLVSAQTEDNPFQAGERKILLQSGLFCEEVVRTRRSLLVKDGRKLEGWKNTPQVLDGWVSHLGHPVFLPGGQLFGTLCVLDRRARSFSEHQKALVLRFKDLVEAQLSVMVLTLRERERAGILAAFREELRQLRGTFPLCPSCKSIRNDAEYWDAVEEYFVTHAMGEFGHGLCPDCAEELWGETLLEPEPVTLPRGLGVSRTARA